MTGDQMDWQAIAPDVAEILLGPPNKHLTTPSQKRWGNRGSIALNVATGEFFDHEQSEGGGVTWLIRRENGSDVREFLDRHGFSDNTVNLSRYRKKRQQAQVEQTAAQLMRAEQAARLWANGAPIEGTPAETYLRSRGIDAWPDGLRYSGDALLFPFRNETGGVIAVQRIILDDQGRKQNKLSLGPIGQGVCLLPGAGDLHLAEGPETGLSVWLATGAPVMICAGPIGARRIAQAGSGPLVLASDAADDGAPVTVTLGRACDAASEAGISYRLALPDGTSGTDWNDVLQASGLDTTRAMLSRGDWIGPHRPATYAAPTGAVIEARAAVASALANWADEQDVQAMRVSTGVGKSYAARKTAVDLVRKLRAEGDSRSVVIAVPRHDLGREYAAKIQAEGITVRVWKGREQPDDDQPDRMMCHRPEDAKKARQAGADVSGTICQNGSELCPFIDRCGYQAMKSAKADIWLIPHAMLWSAPPTAIDPATLIVDEDPTSDAFAGFDTPYQISLDDLRQPFPGLDNTDQLRQVTSTLADALSTSDGPMATDAIRSAFGLGVMDIAAMKTAPYSAVIDRPAGPQSHSEILTSEFARIGPINRRAIRTARLLGMVADALAQNRDTVPGLISYLAKTGDGDGYQAARMHWHKDLHDGWRVPTMIMSATLDADLLRYTWPDVGHITVAECDMPHVTVRQITDSANPKSGLLTRLEGGTYKARGRIKRLARYAETRAHELGGTILIIAQKAVREALEAHGLPCMVQTAHFNALSGLDAFSDVRGLIVIGRTLPGPAVPEMMREILTCEAGQILPKWYDKADAGLNLDGTGYGPRVYNQNGHGGKITYGRDCHPDEITEKLRWQICEAELLQAIGRGRGVNRGPDNPLQIDILTNCPLPMAVDEAAPFADFEPHPFDLMAARGVIVPDTSTKGAWGVVASVLSDVFKDVQAAKDALGRSQWDNRNSIIYGYSTVRDGRLKLDGARYAVPVQIADDARLPTGATFTPEAKTDPMAEKQPPSKVPRIDVGPDFEIEPTYSAISRPIVKPKRCSEPPVLPPGFEPMVFSAEMPADNGDFDLFELSPGGEIHKVWDAATGLPPPMYRNMPPELRARI